MTYKLSEQCRRRLPPQSMAGSRRAKIHDGGKAMKRCNMMWGGGALLVLLIVSIVGCSIFDRDHDSLTGPGNAVEMMNGYVGSGTVGDKYTVCNEASQFCVSLSQGCWLIKYFTSTGNGPHYAAASIAKSMDLAVLGLTQILGGGPATSVSVAMLSGACPVDANQVVLSGWRK